MSAEPISEPIAEPEQGGKKRFISTFNPVLDREIKERMRAARSSILISVFVGLMAGVLYLIYRVALEFFQQSGIFSGGGFTSVALGRIMFEWILGFLLMLVAFIAPGLASASISGEKERKTLHLLQITLLRPRSIALGKLGASTAFLLLMIVAIVPLLMVPIVLGGVNVWQVLKSLLVITSFAVFIVAMSTYFSSVARRSQASTVLAYLMTFLYGVVILGLLFLETFVLGSFGAEPVMQSRPVSLFVNPLVALADAATDERSMGLEVSLLSGIAQFVDRPNDQFQEGAQLGPNGEVILQEPAEERAEPFRLPVWPVFVVLMVAATALFVMLTTLRLRLPSPKFVLGKTPE
ncbi:MAG TPA: ABC transporter permease subunit [Actinomycetota bacterium]|nr:ABC transporter permease subunit [Actinomycetota bacterium]